MEELVTSVGGGHIRKPSSSSSSVHHHLFRGDVDVPTSTACYGYTNYGTDFDDDDDDDGRGYVQSDMLQYQYEVEEPDDDEDGEGREDGELYGDGDVNGVGGSYSDFSVEELHEFMLQQQQQSLLEYACSARRYSLLETIEEETVDDVLKSTSTSSDGGDSIRSSDYSGVWCWGDDFADGTDSVIFVDNSEVLMNGLDRDHDRDVDEFEEDVEMTHRVVLPTSGSDFVDASWLAGSQTSVIQDPSDREGSWLDSSQSESDRANNSRRHTPEVRLPLMSTDRCGNGTEDTMAGSILHQMTPEMSEVIEGAETMATKMTSPYSDNGTRTASKATGSDRDLLIVFDAEELDDRGRPTTTADYGSWSDAIDAYLMSLASSNATENRHRKNTDSSPIRDYVMTMESAKRSGGVGSDVFQADESLIRLIPTKSRSRRPILGVDLPSVFNSQQDNTSLPVIESPSSPNGDVVPVDFDGLEERTEADGAEEIFSSPTCFKTAVEPISVANADFRPAKYEKRRLGTRSTPDLFGIKTDSDVFKAFSVNEDDDFASRSQSEPCVKSSSIANADEADSDVIERQSSSSRKSSDFNFVFGGGLAFDERRKSFALGDDLSIYGNVMRSSSSNRRRSMYSFSSKSYDSQFMSSDDDDENHESSSSDDDDVYDDDEQTGSRSKSLFPRFTPPGTLRSFRSFDSLNLAGKDDDVIENFKNPETELLKNGGTGSGTNSIGFVATPVNSGSGNLWLMDGIEEEECSEVEVEKIRPSSEDLSEDSGCCCDTRSTRCLLKTGSRSLLPIGDDEIAPTTVGSVESNIYERISGTRCGHRKCEDSPCCEVCLSSTGSALHLPIAGDQNSSKTDGIYEEKYTLHSTGSGIENDFFPCVPKTDYESLPTFERISSANNTGSGHRKYEHSSLIRGDDCTKCLPKTESESLLPIEGDRNLRKTDVIYEQICALHSTGSGLQNNSLPCLPMTGYESPLPTENSQNAYKTHQPISVAHDSTSGHRKYVNADFIPCPRKTIGSDQSVDKKDEIVGVNMSALNETGCGHRKIEFTELLVTEVTTPITRAENNGQFHAWKGQKPEANETKMVPPKKMAEHHHEDDDDDDVLNDHDQIVNNNNGGHLSLFGRRSSPSENQVNVPELLLRVEEDDGGGYSTSDRKLQELSVVGRLHSTSTRETETETDCISVSDARNVEVNMEVSLNHPHLGSQNIPFGEGVHRCSLEQTEFVSPQSSLGPANANDPKDIRNPAGAKTPEVGVNGHHGRDSKNSESDRPQPEVNSYSVADELLPVRNNDIKHFHSYEAPTLKRPEVGANRHHGLDTKNSELEQLQPSVADELLPVRSDDITHFHEYEAPEVNPLRHHAPLEESLPVQAADREPPPKNLETFQKWVQCKPEVALNANDELLPARVLDMATVDSIDICFGTRETLQHRDPVRLGQVPTRAPDTRHQCSTSSQSLDSKCSNRDASVASSDKPLECQRPSWASSDYQSLLLVERLQNVKHSGGDLEEEEDDDALVAFDEADPKSDDIRDVTSSEATTPEESPEVDMYLGRKNNSGIPRPVFKNTLGFNDTSNTDVVKSGVFHLVGTEKVRESVNRLESKSRPPTRIDSVRIVGSETRISPSVNNAVKTATSGSFRWPPNSVNSSELLLSTPERNHGSELTTKLINSERALQCRIVTSSSPSDWCEGFDREVRPDLKSERTTSTSKTSASDDEDEEEDEDDDGNRTGSEIGQLHRPVRDQVRTLNSGTTSPTVEEHPVMANNWFTKRWTLEVSKRNQQSEQQQRFPSNVNQNKDDKSKGSNNNNHVVPPAKMATTTTTTTTTGKPPLPPRPVAPCRSKIIDARHQFFQRDGPNDGTRSSTCVETKNKNNNNNNGGAMVDDDSTTDLNRTVERFRQRAREGIERAAKSVLDLQKIESAFRHNLEDELEATAAAVAASNGAATGQHRNNIDPTIRQSESSSNSSTDNDDEDDDDDDSTQENGQNENSQINAKIADFNIKNIASDDGSDGRKRTERSPSIGYLETDIDTLHSREVILVTDQHRRPPPPPKNHRVSSEKKSQKNFANSLKTRSMFNLSEVIGDGSDHKSTSGYDAVAASAAAAANIGADEVHLKSDAILSTAASNSRAKSMEFLLKDEDKATILPPENQLQQNNQLQQSNMVGDDGGGGGVGRTLSEHELRFRRSLQKLNLPDWYKNSPLGRPGGSSTDMLLLRRERQRENRTGGSTNRWEDVRSRSTSVTSLGSQRPPSASKIGGSVVINKRVTTPDWRYVKSSRESLLQSPMSPSLSPSPNTDKSSCFQYYYNSTGISRWSSSRLSSTTAGSSRSTSPTGSAATAPPTSGSGRSSFQRQPYLGWRSSERLARPPANENGSSSSFYRSSAERLSQGPGYYAMRFGSTGYRPPSRSSSTTGSTARPEVTVNVFQSDGDDFKERRLDDDGMRQPEVVRSSPPEHVRVAAELSREIDKMINRNENNGIVMPNGSDNRKSSESNDVTVDTSPRSKRIWMESSFVGVRPIRQPDATSASLGGGGRNSSVANEGAPATPPSPWQQQRSDDIDLPTAHKKQSQINEETNCLPDRRRSLTSTTLEEVLDSLLALPSSSKSPSPSGYPRSPTSTHWDEVTGSPSTGVNEGYGSGSGHAPVIDFHASQNGTTDNVLQASAPPCPEEPEDEDQMEDGEDEPKPEVLMTSLSETETHGEGYTTSSKSSSQVTSNSSTSSSSRNGSTGTTSQRPTSLEGGSSCGSSDLTTATTVGSNGLSSLSASGSGGATSRSSTTTTTTTSGAGVTAIAKQVLTPPPDFTDEFNGTAPKREVSPPCEPVLQESIDEDEDDDGFPPPPTESDIFPDGPVRRASETLVGEEPAQMTAEELEEAGGHERRFSRTTDHHHQTDETVVVDCSYHRCDSTAELRDARRSYKTCHNCYTYYCSRECRKAHWDQHRHVCMYGRIRGMCKQAILCARDNPEFLASLSRLARTGHLTQGPGFVKIVFRNTDLALHFLRHGWSQLEDGPIYVSWKDLLPQEMGVEVYRAVIEMCQRYDPDTKFVLLASIFITREVPSMESVPHWEREVIAKCAKLPLAKSIASCSTADANTLILVGPDRIPRGVVDGASRRSARELCLANIDDRLRERGVSIRHQFPDVYRRLASYVETGSEEPFPPLTIYPKDGLTGHTFTCVIVSNQPSPPMHDGRNIVKK